MEYIFLLIALGVAWLAIGAVLLERGARRVSATGLSRRVARRVVAVGEELEVELEMRPPVTLGQIPDQDLILVLDRSGSMGSGPASRLGEAIRAAKTFLDRCPDQLRIGLVTFNDHAELAAPLGESRAVREALRGVRGEGYTAIDLGLHHCCEELRRNGRPGVPKKVLLLSDGYSDRDTARAAAQALRDAVSGVEICAAALGSGVDKELLAELASGDENVFPVASDGDFDGLFSFLAHRLAGTAALALVADEGTRAPRPFHLLGTTPVTAMVSESTDRQPAATHLQWALPVLDAQWVRLTYRLQAECPGWHSVATDLEVSWSMPDGTPQQVRLPDGPKVLVLPPLLKWAWPILHPLIFLMVGERFCTGVGAGASTPASAPAKPLPAPKLPAALPAVEARPYRPDIGPTLVIGLGESGEAAICRLRHRLDDRGVPADRVCFRLIDLEQGRPASSFGGMVVRPEERLSLACDFYPYLDGLRRDGAPAVRAWVPWQDWLASSRPQTASAEPDRRRARLAVLQEADRFTGFLRSEIREIVDREGKVVIIGSLDDFVASGVVGEVAHLCSEGGARTTMLLAADHEPHTADRAALERELARFLLLRGDAVASDRTSPPALASRLIDRLVVLPAGADAAPASLAEALYAMLAWRSVAERVPTATAQGDRPQVCRAQLEAVVWSNEHLWRWVCDRTLVRDVVVAAVGWNLDQGAAEPVDGEAVDHWLRTFWSGAGTRRPASVLVREGPTLLQGQSVEAALLGCLPFDAPLHEQVTFHRGDRRLFFGYLEDWCHRLLEEERGHGRCGLMLLENTLARLEVDHRRLVDVAEGLLGHPTLAELGRLGADLFTDQRLVVERLYRLVKARYAQWAGARDSVAVRLVADLGRAEQALGAVMALDSLRLRAEKWADEHGTATRARLSFEVSVDLETGSPGLNVWIGDRVLSFDVDPVAALRDELARYRGSVDFSWLPPVAARRAADSRQALRIGGRAQEVFSDLDRSLDESDPFYAGAIAIEEVPLDEALGVVEHRGVDLPFVWPEEANAQRLANWLRQPPIEREPRRWPPRVVHLLRDPERLHGLLGDLALGRIERRGEHWALRCGGLWEPIAEVVPDASAEEALERFEAMVRRVVVLGVSLGGAALPPRGGPLWTADPRVAAEEIERHEAVAPVIGAPGWQVWRDVIQGLLREHASRGAGS